MTTIGWVVCGLIWLIIAAAFVVLVIKKKPKTLVFALALVALVALCVGTLFGAKALFPVKTEEPVIEEQIEEPVIEEPAAETQEETPAT